MKKPTGMTLLEMLVTLVITALLTSFLFQGIGQLSTATESSSRAYTTQLKEYLARSWLYELLSGTVALSSHDRGMNLGQPMIYRGYSLNTLYGPLGRPLMFEIQLQKQNNQTRLMYRDQAKPNDGEYCWELDCEFIELFRFTGNGRFQYRNDNQWKDQWQPKIVAMERQLPEAVRLVVSNQDWLNVVMHNQPLTPVDIRDYE